MPAPVELSTLTTLRLGGPAPQLIVGDTEDAVCAAVDDLDQRGQKLLLIAGGSNLVIADAGVDHPVLLIDHRGVQAHRDGDDLLVDIAAGEPWDAVVEQFVGEGWSGVASLSGIPGSSGATPIQNVGAYGAEISDVLTAVTVYDRRQRRRHTMTADQLGLAYRSSVLRGRSDVVVLSVQLRLTHAHSPIRYGELAAGLGVAPGHGAPPADIRQAVLALRRSKGMVLDADDPDTRSVGSFFTNPLLDHRQLNAADQRIRNRLGDDARYPRYPSGQLTKLSAAWLIEHSGFGKGFALPGSGAAVSTKHTLALTNRGGTTAHLMALARHLRDGVNDVFGVDLHAEPILIGVQL